MKRNLILCVALLLSSLTAFSQQDTVVINPKWRAQLIADDLIRYDQCVIDRELLQTKVGQQVELQSEMQGKIVHLEGTVAEYEFAMVPLLRERAEIAEQGKEIYKGEARKYKRQRNVVVAVVVVAGLARIAYEFFNPNP